MTYIFTGRTVNTENVKTEKDEAYLQVIMILRETYPVNTLVLEWQPLELWENTFVMFKSISLQEFVTEILEESVCSQYITVSSSQAHHS